MAPKDSWTGAARGPSFLGCSHRGWRSVAAAARKNAQKGKKGRVFILVHTYYKAQPISVRCAGKTSFRRYRYFLALDTSAEWSDPIKGFQHRGMIPVLGPRGATPHAHAYRRSRVRSPVRPTLIFLSLEATLPKRPPYATAEPRNPPVHPRSSEDPRVRLRWLPWAQGSTRDPQRSFTDDTRGAGPPKKIQDPLS